MPLLYYCWVGVHRRGGNLKTLSGGRWSSPRELALDVAIALPFWVIWEGTAYVVHWLLGPSSAKSVDSLLPQSLPEILIWIATSITAGICEEMAFRGYLQQQFHALSGNLVMAVLGQGLVFGLLHSYQGWKNVIVICVLGRDRSQLLPSSRAMYSSTDRGWIAGKPNIIHHLCKFLHKIGR